MAAYVWFDSQKLNFINGTTPIDFATNSFKLGLMKTGFGGIGQTLWSGIAAGQCVGTNYPPDGFPVTVTLDVSGSTKIIFVADLSVGQSDTGFTDARFAVLYEVASGQLIAYQDFLTDLGNVVGDLSIKFDQTAGCLALG